MTFSRMEIFFKQKLDWQFIGVYTIMYVNIYTFFISLGFFLGTHFKVSWGFLI